MLWDIPKNRRQRVIDDLCACSLVKFSNDQYFLHPVIRAEARDNFTLIKEFNNEHLLLIKQEINLILAKEKTLQLFLAWLNQKSLSFKFPYKKAVIRALYFDIELGHTIDRYLYYAFNAKFDFKLDIDIVVDLDLANALEFFKNHAGARNPYAHAKNIKITFNKLQLSWENSFELVLVNNDDKLDPTPLDRDSTYALMSYFSDFVRYISFDLNIDCYSNSKLEQALQELKQQLPDIETDEDIYNQWWQLNGQFWINQLRNILIEYRNMGHNWHLNQQQKQLLEQYYEANLLLLKCLNTDCNVSPKVRSHIEDTLLLPITEIEKRPFKN